MVDCPYSISIRIDKKRKEKREKIKEKRKGRAVDSA
jgi:hypothetical protein